MYVHSRQQTLLTHDRQPRVQASSASSRRRRCGRLRRPFLGRVCTCSASLCSITVCRRIPRNDQVGNLALSQCRLRERRLFLSNARRRLELYLVSRRQYFRSGAPNVRKLASLNEGSTERLRTFVLRDASRGMRQHIKPMHTSSSHVQPLAAHVLSYEKASRSHPPGICHVGLDSLWNTAASRHARAYPPQVTENNNDEARLDRTLCNMADCS